MDSVIREWLGDLSSMDYFLLLIGEHFVKPASLLRFLFVAPSTGTVSPCSKDRKGHDCSLLHLAWVQVQM